MIKQRSRRPPDWIIWGQVAALRPGLDHPERNEKERLQPPGLDYPGEFGLTPRTGSSMDDQAETAAAPRTGSSGDKWRPYAPDGIIRG